MGGKGTLEADNIVAVLRSEYVKALDAKFASNDAVTKLKIDKIAILPEILTVTVPESTFYPKWKQGPAKRGDSVTVRHDGFQLRDLAAMNRNLRYFPALSVPWVTAVAVNNSPAKHDLSTFKSQYDMDDAEFHAWDEYWSKNYAVRVGQAKALIHLLYGFQPQTPNSQNFVLEFDPNDMTDMKRVLVSSPSVSH